MRKTTSSAAAASLLESPPAITEPDGGFRLGPTSGPALKQAVIVLVTTRLPGNATAPGCASQNRDGKPLRIDTGDCGAKLIFAKPLPAPFEAPEGGRPTINAWPRP